MNPIYSSFPPNLRVNGEGVIKRDVSLLGDAVCQLCASIFLLMTAGSQSITLCVFSHPYLVKFARFCKTLAISVKVLEVFSLGYPEKDQYFNKIRFLASFRTSVKQIKTSNFAPAATRSLIVSDANAYNASCMSLYTLINFSSIKSSV